MNADSDLDVVSLTVDGKIIEGWDSVRVTRGIERFPSDFDLGLSAVLAARRAIFLTLRRPISPLLLAKFRCLAG